MYHEYGYTDFHELNLDFILREMQKYTGLKLAVAGDKLSLVNDRGETINSVTVSYATKSLTDQNGRNIDTYIFSVAGVGDTVVFTHGDGTSTAITVPYAEKSKYDLTGHEIEDYVFNTQIAGDKVRITHGDGTIVDLVIPFATSASTDADGKDLTTYAASLSVENDNICLRDAKGRLLDSVVASYATRALKDDSGNVIESSYASTLQTGTTTVILKANDGTVLSTITVPYATESSHATNSDLATLATDATNAIETVAISGDYIVFTTYGGQAYSIQSPFSVKAQKDDLGNPIKTTYVAGVTNNAQTGALEFRDAMGNIIVSLLPTVDTAVHDDYGNALADYVKTIVASSGSDYVTVTHGDGDVDTLTINYSNTAWKDTNNNVIKNTYIKDLQVEEDVNDGHFKLVAYNGDNPQAELFRIEIVAYSAQTDINGKDLTSYVADVDYNASKQIIVKDGEGNTLKTLQNKLNNIGGVNVPSPNAGDVLTYDGNTGKWINQAPSAGASGPYYPVTGATFPVAALIYDAGWAYQVAIPISKALYTDIGKFPTVTWGSSLINYGGETWQEFTLADDYFFDFLPADPVIDGKTIYSNTVSGGVFAVQFKSPKVGGMSTLMEPARSSEVRIDGVWTEYDFNSDKITLYVRGAVKTSSLYSTNTDLLYQLYPVAAFPSTEYLELTGTMYFYSPH